MPYIQKKIDGNWRTVLTVCDDAALDTLAHLSWQYPYSEYKVIFDLLDKKEKTPLAEALDKLQMVLLDNDAYLAAFKIICKLDERYKRMRLHDSPQSFPYTW